MRLFYVALIVTPIAGAEVPRTRLLESFGSLPLSFERHGSQFVSRGPGYSLSVTSAGAVLQLGGGAVHMRVAGAEPHPPIEALDHMPGTTNYFLGSDVRATSEHYARVRCRSIYPGIDLIFHGSQQRLEYDFYLGPHRDPGAIALAFEGADNLRISQNGDLVLRSGTAEIRQPKPIAWQEFDGRRHAVPVSYRLDAAHRVRFRVGPHDRARALVIDPVLVFDTAFGGSSGNAANAIALDAQGNAYIAGTTSSIDFPAGNGLQGQLGTAPLLSSADGGKSWSFPATGKAAGAGWIAAAPSQAFGDIFITKWNPAGNQMIYSSYLGGSGSDSPTGIAVDNTGSVYITGNTTSQNFPVTAGAFQKTLAGQQNSFVAKLSPDGSRLVYSTLLGGGSEQTGGIAVDRAGSAHITGHTVQNFPVTPGAFQTAPGDGKCPGDNLVIDYPQFGDAFAAKLSPDGGSLVYGTLLGGTCGDWGYAIALDSGGNAWVAGTTYSQNFPVTADALQPQYEGGFGDGFVARLTPQGNLAYSTFLGGKGNDDLRAMAFDGSGNLYLTGMSFGFSQPASAGAFQPQVAAGCITFGIGPPVFNPQGNAFVMKLNPGATSVAGLTYIGNPCSVNGTSIAVDSSGAPWISGFVDSIALPTASPFRIRIGNGFISRFSPDLTQLLFSTYFDSVTGLALDANGMAYVAGSFIPSVPSIFQPPAKAYFAKIDPAATAVSLDGVLDVTSLPAVFGIGITAAPGKVLRIVGKGMGPAARTAGVITSAGAVATSAAGVQVTFDGMPAPLLTVSAAEILCIAPFGLTGRLSTSVQVQSNGVQSNAVLIPVAPAALNVLAVLNGDFTLNSPSNPARPGSIVTLYVTGAGQTNPPSSDGQVNRAPLAQPGTPVRVGSSSPYEVTFAAAAYGLAAGILQVNFRAPQQTTTNVNISVGGNVTYFDVAVQ